MTTSEHADAAWQLGHELMQPMPPGWRRTLHELMDGSWQVVMVDDENYGDKGWPEQLDYAVSITAATLVEAYEICREQAWAKHRKNTGGA